MREARVAADAGAGNAYIDAGVCASCHAEIASTFSKTGMGRSFYRPTTENVIEDYRKANTFVHKKSGLRYTMVERDGRFFQRRSTLDAQGHETNVLEEKVDYVIGSGNHARTYLHRTARGKLIELPVSWYVENSGSWAMSPGFDRVDQPDMHGAIGPECMFCHNAYVRRGEVTAETDVFPEKLPEGIDCQRCHGPGAAHVQAATSGKANVEDVRSRIVNPAKLSRERQMEVCMECHLETSARHLPNAIRNYERDIESFRPGQELGDYKTYFERPKNLQNGSKPDDFEVAHAAYQLPHSACYRNSQMTCLTCHNPHNIPRGVEAKQHYIAVCQNCHTKVIHTNVKMTSGSDCLSCHMPKRRTEGSVHTVLTDHYIQRIRPARNLIAPFPEPVLPGDKTPVEIYYPKSAPTARMQLLLAVARAGDAGIDGTGDLRKEIDRQHPSAPEPYVALGRAYTNTNRTNEAIQSFEQALKNRPDDPAALKELSSTLLASGQLDRAIGMLQRASVKDADNDSLLANLANAYLQQGRLDEAQSTLSRAMAVDPERADLHNLEGLCAVRRNDTAAAEQAFREAIRLQPNLAEPENNLANLLAGQQRFAEAESHFQRALALNSEYGDAHHGLGLLLILEHKSSEALEQLQAAARTSPRNAQVHADLADLLSAMSRADDAAAEYRHALEIDRMQPDANFGLGMILLQQNQPAAAVEYLQQAAAGSNPEIGQHARAILQQILR
jgi:Flp pilus assembly protein TadD